MDSGRYVVRATAVVLVINLLSRFLGFARDVSIGGVFGASGYTDAYLVAYTVPYALQAVLGMTLATVMIPVITGFMVQGKEQEGWGVASTVINFMAIFLTAAVVVGILFAPYLVNLIAPGFEPELSRLTTEMARIMSPSILLMGLGMLVTGVLNANRIFAAPSMAPGVSNVIIILAVIFGGDLYDIRVLAWGTLVGFVGFLLIQIPDLRKTGFRYLPELNLKHPEVKKVLVTVIPVFLALSVNQIYLAFNRVFASGLQAGSITALDFSYRVINLPLGIFVAAIATVIFPSLAEQAVQGRKKELAGTLRQGLVAVLMVAVPASVVLGILGVPVVRLLFERGAFDSEATQLTASALSCFAVGLSALGFNLVLNRAYYALGNVLVPVVSGLLSVGVNIVLSLVFLPLMAHAGLALANSLAAFTNTLFLLAVMRKHIPSINLMQLGSSTGKVILAAVAMVLAVLAGQQVLKPMLNDSRFLLLLMGVAVIAGIGVLVFLAGVYFLRLREIKKLKEILLCRKG